MKRSSCRNLVVSISTVLVMVELFGPSPRAQAELSPAIGLRHIALSQNVWPGDFNGDGKTDLAGSEPPPSHGGTGRVVALVGDGHGNFPARNVTSYVGRVLGVGDFNGDGRIDLIVVDDGNANVAILPGNGDATFGAPRAVTATADVTFALSADLDGDGKRDLVVGAEGVTVALFPGNGDFTFGTAVTLPVNASPHDGIIADFNGDGKKDLAVANHYFHGVTVLLNQGALQFSGADVALGGNGNDVTVADVNRDGKLDLIVATSNGGDGDFWFEEGHAEVLLGRGDGTFATGPVYEVPRGAWQVVAGDFTRDGIVDIATANRSSIFIDDCTVGWKTWDSVSILPGRSDGTFGAASSFSLGNQSDPGDEDFKNQVLSLNTSDLNADGATDLIASWGAVLLNIAAGTNQGPTVDAGPDQTVSATDQFVLQARAADNDQDMLTWIWRDATGAVIAEWPTVCFSSLHDGANTFSVTVDDGHGHQTTDTMTVTAIGDPNGGGSGPAMTLTAPAEGATIAAGAPYTVTFHIDDPSMTLKHWSVDYSLDNGATWSHIRECHNAGQPTSPGIPTSRDESCTWQNPGPTSTRALLIVYAQNDANAAIGISSSAHFIIAPQAGNVPYPWQQQDIGAVGQAGTTTYNDSNGVFTVSASGADIWGTADEFRYTYLAGNGAVLAVSARVESVQNVHAWTKAGVMIRAGLGAQAPQASLFVTPGKGISFQRRLTTGGSSVSTPGPLLTAPVWLKLVTQIDAASETVRAYYRTNVSDPWTLVGQDTFPAVISQPVAGIAVSSHADPTLATANVSNVSVIPVANWTTESIGVSGGRATSVDTTITLNGIGADIWGTADQFEYAYQQCVVTCTITARVNSLQNTNQWAKAGVMMRESTLGNSRQVDVIVSPTRGVAMQYRAATGNVSATAGAHAGAAPGWVRLTRNGSVFTGHWSTDGVTFTQVGSVTVPMNASMLVGVAATSHNITTATTAIFDDVVVRQQ